MRGFLFACLAVLAFVVPGTLTNVLDLIWDKEQHPAKAPTPRSRVLTLSDLRSSDPDSPHRIKQYAMPESKLSVKRTLSVYSNYYVGRTMSNGKKFRHENPTCATNDWPLGTRLFVQVGDRIMTLTVTDRMAKRFSGKRVDLPRVAWDYLSKGKKPGLIHGAKVEVLK